MILTPSDKINTLKNKYLLLRAVEFGLVSMGCGAIVFSIASFFIIPFLWKFFIAFFVFVFLFGYLGSSLFKISNLDIARYLNQQYKELEQSADLLLLNDNRLSLLQQIQYQRTLLYFSKLYPEIKLPHRLFRALYILIIAAGVSALLLLVPDAPWFIQSLPSPTGTTIIQPNDKKPSEINAVQISVFPPSYTGLKNFTSGLSLKVPEKSRVHWMISFNQKIKSVSIIFAAKDSIPLTLNEKNYVGEKVLSQSGFYQFVWIDQNENIFYSDFYRIEIILDAAPKVEITNLNQFTKVNIGDSKMINVISHISDDYNLTHAIIVATVSKGSGESLKFREEQLRFDKPAKISGKKVQAERLLDLNQLGLEPGDELYFYVEARDNKFPIPNRKRTETYFIALQDTATVSLAEDEGLGVDLLPDYFRSQRQIIIDTEKLLKDKKIISPFQFRSTSNELGFDQKTLRLKYGEFLGEEANEGIGAEATHTNEEEEKDLTKKFGHQHDTKNEHNLVAEKKEHDHHENQDISEKKNPLAAFSHNHDNEETATFFEQSLRAKLKAAITVMWDAELYLRLVQPEKSLPYQYQALKLLKEITNYSRIYVHRMGFDQPPLKEEKRLTANLSDVTSPDLQSKIIIIDNVINIKTAVQIIEKFQQGHFKISPSDRSILQKAGEEFARIALQNPSALPALSLLRRLADQPDLIQHNQLIFIKKVLWQVLPTTPGSPSKSSVPLHEANRLFIKHIEKENE